MTQEAHANIAVVVPYNNNKTGLAVTLMTLQSQLVPPCMIIVIDTSPEKSGIKVANQYNTNRCLVVVECAQVSIYEAWNRGIDLATKSFSDCDIAFLNDDLLLPMNFIDILAMSRAGIRAYCFVPITPPSDHYMNFVDVPFEHYSQVPERKDQFSEVKWMPGFCFMLTREAIKIIGLFDTRFTVWYGDTDYQARMLQAELPERAPIIRIDTMFVFHYGGASFDYQSADVKTKIMTDKEKFDEKYAAQDA